MKNLQLENYPPLAQKSIVFYEAAKKLYIPQNRTADFSVPAYYCLSHALELAIKSVYETKTGKKASWGHRLVPLGQRYKKELKFSDEDIKILREFDKLNSGHGLRYVNQPKTEFYPETFTAGQALTEKLLEHFE